jgi:hypothetical protein
MADGGEDGARAQRRSCDGERRGRGGCRPERWDQVKPDCVGAAASCAAAGKGRDATDLDAAGAVGLALSMRDNLAALNEEGAELVRAGEAKLDRASAGELHTGFP